MAHAPVLRVLSGALALCVLAGCGAARSSPAAKPPSPSPAVQAAIGEALAGNGRGVSVLRAHPRQLAAAIRASFQDPSAVLLGGDPYLSLATDLPRSLGLPIVERALAHFGLFPYGYTLPHAFLLREIRSGPAWAATGALVLALQPSYVQGQVQTDGTAFWLQALEAAPAGAAPAAAWGVSGSPPFLGRVLGDPHIVPAIKLAVLSTLYPAAGSVPVLRRYAEGAADGALKEQALIDLAETGSPSAVSALAAYADRHQAYAGVIWPASVETAVGKADPRGYIAQGMAAVSALTHAPYADTARCSPQRPYCAFWLVGPSQYDPRELTAWQALLGTFGRHPGSDDVAYIIGRIDEIDHRYGDAVLAFYRALALPDGDMRYEAANRLLWVLDVEMTSQDVSRLTPRAPAALAPLLRYAAGVHLLREGRDDAAIRDLQASVAAGKRLQQALSAVLDGAGYGAPTPFLTYFVRWQLGAAVTLRRLNASAGTPEGAFRLARYTYRTPLLYYLGLWQGGRSGYIAFGSGGTIPSPAWMRYQREFNQDAVAARLYARAARLAGSDIALRAKDLYGEGESLVALADYGSGTDLVPPLQVAARAEGLLRQAAQADPHGSVGGAALMSLFYLTGQRSLLGVVRKEYPGTSAAYDAALREEPRYAYAAAALPPEPAVDFEPLYTSNRLRPVERAAIAASRSTAAHVLGRETLLVVAPRLPAVEEPAIESVQETVQGTLIVHWGTYRPAQVPGLAPVLFPGKACARVFWDFAKVRFAEVATPPSFGGW